MTRPDAPDHLDEGAFTPFVKGLDYPVYVVTAAAKGETSSCLVGFATQSSIDPPRLLVCISQANHTHGVAAGATHLAVHLVPAGRCDLAELFGGTSGDDIDKLAGLAWTPGPGGVPLLADCPRRLVGEVLARHDLGDHTGHLLAPVSVTTPDGPTLTFADVSDIDAGHDAEEA